jgi:hypothetical protein
MKTADTPTISTTATRAPPALTTRRACLQSAGALRCAALRLCCTVTSVAQLILQWALEPSIAFENATGTAAWHPV